MHRQLLWIALACAPAGAAAADVYKWTDKDGVVHYADSQPPAPPDAEHVHVAGAAKPKAAAAANDADEAATPPAAANAVAGGPPGTVAKSEPVSEKRCEQARADLAVLQAPGPVGVDKGNGQAEPLDDKARAQKIASTQSAIALFCKH